VSLGESRARVCGWVPSAGQVSLSVSVGWGETEFYATATNISGMQGPRRVLEECLSIAPDAQRRKRSKIPRNDRCEK